MNEGMDVFTGIFLGGMIVSFVILIGAVIIAVMEETGNEKRKR
jgi:hypothetical protein